MGASETGKAPEEGRSPREDPEGKRETWYDDDSIFYWMDRDEEQGLEPLSYLGTFFPNGCRFCM
jgi:hypothetical protein